MKAHFFVIITIAFSSSYLMSFSPADGTGAEKPIAQMVVRLRTSSKESLALAFQEPVDPSKLKTKLKTTQADADRKHKSNVRKKYNQHEHEQKLLRASE